VAGGVLRGEAKIEHGHVRVGAVRGQPGGRDQRLGDGGATGARRDGGGEGDGGGGEARADPGPLFRKMEIPSTIWYRG